MSDADHFRLCSSCKKPLAFGAVYYRCSVSTCNRQRMELTFCSVSCWDAHLPEARHRDAWAEEMRAPSEAQHRAALAAAADRHTERERRASSPTVPLEARMADDVPEEVLIVVSKLKKYVKARSGMNTSEGAIDVLSDIVRRACDDAIRRAGQDDRRTVMARDFEEP